MERPILFNTEMVQAILEGRKTQTRRIIDKDIFNWFDVDVDGTVISYIDQETGDKYPPREACRYSIGDILWVQETWNVHALNSPAFCMMIKYKADNSTNLQVKFKPLRFDKFEKFYHKNGWQSPYFMPREAARILLKVTDVRVEQLQAITADDIRSEGLSSMGVHCGDMKLAIPEWKILWNSTIKKQDIDKYGWNANPWVWVIEFERVNAK